jgi:hypothetical protein
MGLGGRAASSKCSYLHAYNPSEWEIFYQEHQEFQEENDAFSKYGLDPLEVTSPESRLGRYKKMVDEGGRENSHWPFYRLVFSGDYLHKFGMSGGGGYEIGLPCPALLLMGLYVVSGTIRPLCSICVFASSEVVSPGLSMPGTYP